jgi:hypothetical protein
MSRARLWTRIGLLGLILLATGLRFYRLDAQDIWGDEAFSISLSLRPLPEVVAGAADTHPPLYPALLFYWLELAGKTAFATRALSALTGILVIPFIFILARRMAPARPRLAWFAALLAAVSPLLIYYSQETRMYELVTLLALASAYFCLTFFPAPAQDYTESGTSLRSKRVGAYFVCTLAALYTHYEAFFVVAAENLFVVFYCLNRRREFRWEWLRDWMLTQALLIVCYVPWIVVQTAFLRGKASTRFDEWSWRGIEMIFGKTFLAFSGGLAVQSPFAQIVAVLFLGLAGLGVWAVLQSGARAVSPPLWIAPLYFGVPVIIAWAIDPVMPFFFERYVLVALPGFYLTVAMGLDSLRVAQRSLLPSFAAAGVLLVVSALALSNYYYDDAYAKGKYGQMMAYVTLQAQPGDGLILNNPLQKPLYDYYRPQGVTAFYLPDGAPLEDPGTRQQLADIANNHARLWLVMFGNPAEYDPTGYLKRWLGAHSFKTYEQGYVDASLSLYVMPASATIHRTRPLMVGDKIRFAGYDLDRADWLPGQTIQLTLHWQAAAPVSTNYKVFTHLITVGGELNPETHSPVWAQIDGEPVGGSRPTVGWQVGETIDDLYGLQLPENISPGDYVIEVGMYDPATMARLPVRDENGAKLAEDRILLETVKIKGK